MGPVFFSFFSFVFRPSLKKAHSTHDGTDHCGPHARAHDRWRCSVPAALDGFLAASQFHSCESRVSPLYAQAALAERSCSGQSVELSTVPLTLWPPGNACAG